MRDELLEAGSVFDWISPLLGFLGGIANGPSHTFLIPHDCGWSGRDVARFLKQQGVKTWGEMIVDGTLMVSVCLNQARFAQYLLDRAGIPVENPVAGRTRSGTARRASTTGDSDRPAGVGDTLRGIMDLRLF